VQSKYDYILTNKDAARIDILIRMRKSIYFLAVTYEILILDFRALVQVKEEQS